MSSPKSTGKGKALTLPSLTLAPIQDFVANARAADPGAVASINSSVAAHIRGSQGQYKAASLRARTRNNDLSWVNMGKVGAEWTTLKLTRAIRATLAQNNIEARVRRVIKRGGGIVNVEFESEDEATVASHVGFIFGNVLSHGRILDNFYRVIFKSDSINPAYEEQILNHFVEELDITPTSLTFNPDSNCISVYVPDIDSFRSCLTLDKFEKVVIPVEDEEDDLLFYVSRCNSSTDDPEVIKMMVSNIPSDWSDLDFLEAIKVAVGEVIPEELYLGFGIHRYPDSNKSAPFGFLFIQGESAFGILSKVEIPAGGDEPIKFVKAKESKDSKRKRESEEE